MLKNNIQRYIKTPQGVKSEMHVTSVNITKEQQRWLEDNGLNLSKIVRDSIEALRNEGGNEK